MLCTYTVPAVATWVGRFWAAVNSTATGVGLTPLCPWAQEVESRIHRATLPPFRWAGSPQFSTEAVSDSAEGPSPRPLQHRKFASSR